MVSNSCIFCKIIAREIPSKIEYETDSIIVIHDIQPKAPIHLLVLPKTHVQDVASLTDEQLNLGGGIIKVCRDLAKKLGLSSFNIVTNNGQGAGQSVFHLHFHLLAGKNLYQQGGISL